MTQESAALPARPLSQTLEARHFAHPLDVAARQRVDRAIARWPRIQKFFESAERSAEQGHYVTHLADDTRLSQRQAPSLYRVVEEVAADAGMQTPRVFLDTKPTVNAFALGQHNPILVINSALVDQFTESQMRAVIAHELGHIRCQHTFYTLVAHRFEKVSALAGSLPGGSLLALALQWYLRDWYRKGELSADRFSLLVTGDLEAVQTMIIQLAGGASRIGDELSSDEFRLQAKEFRDASGPRQNPRSVMEKVEYYVTELLLNPDLSTHPWPAIRFVELEDWAHSRQYALIAAGNLEEAQKHPYQFLPDTVIDDNIETPAADGPMASPVLRQTASEVAGMWKSWTTKQSPPVRGNPQPTDRGATPPPGWHPDPHVPNQWRLWDGSKWTDEVRPT